MHNKPMVQCYNINKKFRMVHQMLFTSSAHCFLSVAIRAKSSRLRLRGQSAISDPTGTVSLPITYANNDLRSKRSGGSRKMCPR